MIVMFNHIVSYIVRMVVSMILLLVSSVSVSAQNVNVVANLDTAKALVGDQVRLTLVAEVNESEQLVWPVYGDTIVTGLEIIEHGKIDTVKVENTTTYSQTLLITSFDSGYYVIPPMLFVDFTDTSNNYQTEPILLEVTSIPIDTTLAIKDIKGPMETPVSFEEIAPYVFGGLALIGLICLVVYLLKRFKKKPREIVEKKPITPAHILAVRRLKELENKKLWQNDKVKLYYTELTDILRTYIQDRFGIIAMEQTTHETLASYKSYSVDDSMEKLKQILVLADMVKFAKAKPLANEHIMSFDNACAFVEVTKPEEKGIDTVNLDNHSINDKSNG